MRRVALVALLAAACGAPAVEFVRAETLLDRRCRERALDLLHPFLRRNPNHARGYELRGRVYLQFIQGERNALADFDRAIEIDPAFIEAYEGRAEARMRLDEPGPARSDFAVVVAAHPEDAGAWTSLGWCAERMGDTDAAAAAYDTALLAGPSGDARVHRARLRMRSGDFEGAREDADALERTDAGYALYALRSQLNVKLGDWDAAIDDLWRMYRIESAMPVNEDGAYWNWLRQVRRTVAGLHDRFIADPRDIRAWTRRADLFNELGRHEAAAFDAGRALRLDPTDAAAHQERARAALALSADRMNGFPSPLMYHQPLALLPRETIRLAKVAIHHYTSAVNQGFGSDLIEERARAYGLAGAHERAITELKRLRGRVDAMWFDHAIRLEILRLARCVELSGSRP